MRGSYQDGSDDQFSRFLKSDKYHTLPFELFCTNDQRRAKLPAFLEGRKLVCFRQSRVRFEEECFAVWFTSTCFETD